MLLNLRKPALGDPSLCAVVPVGISAEPVADVLDTNPSVDITVTCQDVPLYILVSLLVVLKYQSPAVTASPLLSTVGLDDCAPR